MKLICTFIVCLLIGLGLLGCNSSTPTSQPTAPAAQSPLVTIDKSTAGYISGVINFKGAAPKFSPIDMTADPGCPSKPGTAEVVVVKNGKLANVFVYVKEGLPRGRFAPPIEPVVLSQKGCSYTPHVLGVMTGQPFKVLNEDTSEHNIHSMSAGNPPFNESQMPTDQPILKTFQKPEMHVVLECNQHPWMKAYLNVMSHPYFDVSATDGTFTIKDLPPGEYTLAAVHEKYGEQTRRIKVGPKESAKTDFAFTAN
jgi:Protein of unknown function (DUF2012)